MNQIGPITDAKPGASGKARPRRGWLSALKQESRRGLPVLAGAAATGTLIAGLSGFLAIPYTARVLLVHEPSPPRSSSTQSESATAPMEPAAALSAIARSPELAHKAAKAAGLGSPSEKLAESCRVTPIQGTDFVEVSVRDRDGAAAASLANAYAREIAEALHGLGTNQAGRAWAAAQVRLDIIGRLLDKASADLSNFQRARGVVDSDEELTSGRDQRVALERKSVELSIRIKTLEFQIDTAQREVSSHHPELLSARQALDRALLRMTDEHPAVQGLRSNLAIIQARVDARTNQVDPELALAGNGTARELYSRLLDLRTQRETLIREQAEVEAAQARLLERISEIPRQRVEHARLKSQFDALRAQQQSAVEEEQRLSLAVATAPAPYRLHAPAQVAYLGSLEKWRAALMAAPIGAVLGLIAGAAGLLGARARRPRITTPLELEQLTGLTVWTDLGDLRQMSAAELETWAFRTLTTLLGRLKGDPNQGLVCGFISSRHGEGKTTWIQLLADAAEKQGYRVLTIAPGAGAAAPGAGAEPSPTPLPGPCEITHRASGALVRRGHMEIPAPGWAWNLERRQQWRDALVQAAGTPGLVVFFELPPACEPEGILLAEQVANLVWLCGKDMALASETRAQLDMLHHSRSRLAGAVWNHVPPQSTARSLTRAAAAALALACMLACASAQNLPNPTDEEPPEPQPSTTERAPAAPTPAPNVTNMAPVATEAVTNAFSIIQPTMLAPWQQRLTLGPSDVMNISIYGEPASARDDVIIGPDGRLNYLQARDVEATGLTVDELRAKLEQILLRYYRPPLRVKIAPVAYRSKRYYLLGAVGQAGMFALDRPYTLLEAIASAGGFTAGTQRRNTFTLVDWSRSFLVRKGESNTFYRLLVDFEALFTQGDLTQNIGMAPDDYLYFAPSDPQEIYVLGDGIRGPGPVLYSEDLSVMRVIAMRGGFADKAWRRHILVVRGSLKAPQTYVINMNDILKARDTDFQLKPGDIVYVSRRPWAKAEELLESATSDFLRAAVVTWTGANIGPFITRPIF